MTKIEDMACVASIVFQHLSCPLQRNISAGKNKCGIEVSLDNSLCTETRACIGNLGAPVETHDCIAN